MEHSIVEHRQIAVAPEEQQSLDRQEVHPPSSFSYPGIPGEETVGTTSTGAIDALTVLVYERALAHHSVLASEIAVWLRLPTEAVERAIDVLRELRLVKYCGTRNAYIAVSPEAAQLELVFPLEQAIHDKRRELSDINRQLQPFTEVFGNVQRKRLRSGTVVVSSDQDEILLRLADAIRRCTHEILAVWPDGIHMTTLFTRTMVLANEALQRGVNVRLLYPHTARSHMRIRSDMEQYVTGGALVRTSDEFSDFVVVADDQAAFIQDHTASQDTFAVSALYESSVVNHLRRTYENAWQAAKRFDGQVSSPYGDTLDELKITILRMLASGLKDDVIARRVGIAPRTLRRHISVIMKELRVDSRFQAGVAAAEAGFLQGAALV
ncbi:LuxR C-terminal-related transcriptional regulator [Streptomyces sp. NPDC088180]|uniref:helix-turn-helix transcriptional regulator n=1 Tax=Streptomyces sp. NPDC088180 TaxID=3365837 RepID=UPI003829F20A